ncbi:cysteine synthase [Thermoplasmatales archaeon BRNA1]|nr:cysteine synthase [Thermoplasmatales archaeon BRNA1]
MAIFNSITETIGNTPLVRLGRMSPAGSSVYVKIERGNPGGSIKDRAVLSIINDAEAKGRLSPGGTIIEPTSGNTGIAIAMIAAARGYKAVMVMPDTMTKERIALMKAYGAEVVLTPGKLGMQGSVDKANELCACTPNSIIAGQFDNPANILAHRTTTGREILADLPDVDFVVAGFGTGGTASGIAWALKDAGSDGKVIAVEPAESALVSSGSAGPHKIQGIGANFVPGNLDRDVVGTIETVKGDDAVATARRLAREEGIFCGISAGANVFKAIEIAQRHPGSKVVAILPDGGDKYVSTGIYD